MRDHCEAYRAGWIPEPDGWPTDKRGVPQYTRMRLGYPPPRQEELILHPRLGYGRQIPSDQEAPTSHELPSIIGLDERRLIINTLAVPFRWICALDLIFANPDNPRQHLRFRGTGTLISPRHVLTAAHNLYDVIEGPGGNSRLSEVRRVVVTPGLNGANPSTLRPFGSSQSTQVRTSSQWRSSQSIEHDFGLITLRDPLGSRRFRALGQQPLGFWGSRDQGANTRINPREPSFLQNKKVNLCGYPGDKCRDRPPTGSATEAQIQACPIREHASTQWNSYDRIVQAAPAAAPRMMFYLMDVFGGQSGSPIWLRWREFRNLIGIHTGAPAGQKRPINQGVRITPEVLRAVRAWL
jgi:V8-like Glu-specific endopeptidase